MNNPKPYPSKKIKWFTIIRIVGLVLFVIILFNIDIKEIWGNIQKVSILFLILGLLSQGILLFVKGWRWHILNKGENFKKSLGEFFESYAIGVFTPGRLGELMKAGHQKERSGVIVSGIRIFGERGIDIGIFVIIGGIAILMENYGYFPPFLSLLVIATGVFVLLLAIFIIGSQKPNQLFSKLLKITNLHSYKLSINQTIAIVGLSGISNFFAFISCYFLALGIKMDISFLGLSGGIAIAGLFNMLPITIMGLGTRELTFLYIFRGYSETVVLALSGLVFFVAQLGGAILAMTMGQIILYSVKNKVVRER